MRGVGSFPMEMSKMIRYSILSIIIAVMLAMGFESSNAQRGPRYGMGAHPEKWVYGGRC